MIGLSNLGSSTHQVFNSIVFIIFNVLIETLESLLSFSS